MRTGNINSAVISAKTPAIVMPMSRKGSDSSQTTGYNSSAMSASGQHKNSRMQKSSSLITATTPSRKRVREVRGKGSATAETRAGPETVASFAGELERIVAIDWSGDASATGQRRKIWAGMWTAGPGGVLGGSVALESGRTRAELVDALLAMSRETPRMVVGVDFCFSYPAWFVREHGAASAMEFWEIVAAHGERWLARECEEARFWGRTGPRRTGKKPAEFCGDAGALRMLRRADEACKVRAAILDAALAARVKGIAPKSPFQIGGAGAVGTGTLRGIPELQRLHAAGFKVWPFEEPALRAKMARPLMVEIYPRLLTGEVHKGSATARAAWLAKRRGDAGYRALGRGVLAKACASEDAFDALASVLAMAAQRASFLALRKATDPVTLMEGAVWGAG